MDFGRTVTLVVVDDQGGPLGTLPAFRVDCPYWLEVSDVVATARRQFGLDIQILRLLDTERPVPHGGAVTYLAQTSPARPSLAQASAPPVQQPPPWSDQQAPDSLTRSTVHNALTPHPARPAYADVGGPAADLSWAERALNDAGRGPLVASAQQRTWNLSAIWRLETGTGVVWLKHVPAFFAHEATVLRWAASTVHNAQVALLIADDRGRQLIEHIPGEDLYDCPPDRRDAIAADMHTIQVKAAAHTAQLLAAGVPDRRAQALAPILRAVVDNYRPDDPALRGLLAELDDRFAALSRCGMPDTLVHGDLHPGNVVGTPAADNVIIDWGDSFIGHPGFDILRLTGGLGPDHTAGLIDAWVHRWRAACPGSDPATALSLLRPVAALRNAAVYAAFLDAIEPTEHGYHRADVDIWLTEAANAPR